MHMQYAPNMDHVEHLESGFLFIVDAIEMNASVSVIVQRNFCFKKFELVLENIFMNIIREHGSL